MDETTRRWKPHSKYVHVFVVIRIDMYQSPPMVALTRAFWTSEDAEAEVRRLNEVNADKNCLYDWDVARLEPLDVWPTERDE
jgi:hypothetical protein